MSSDNLADKFLGNTPAAEPVNPAQSMADRFLGNESGVGQAPGVDQRLANYDKLQAKYGTLPQQALTAVEGGGEGFAGPVATGVERGLSALGVDGLTPEDQAGRQEANPLLHGVSEVGGFGLGALFGTGEAAVLAKLGKSAEALSAVSKLSPLLKTGIRVGAETAALQAGHEISKVINQDPNQSLGSAAVNIGLSGILGGAGGVALGAVPKAWDTVANKLKVARFGSDYMERIKLLQGAVPEVVEEAPVAASSDSAMQKVFDPFTKKTKEIPVSEAGNWARRSQTYDPFLKKYVGDTAQSVPEVVSDLANEAPKPRDTLGERFAEWTHKTGADELAGKISSYGAKTIGGIAGAFVGHPIVGAWVGEKLLEPTLRSIAKPFAEMATNVEAMKSVFDYAAQVAKGQYALGKAAGAFFQSGELLPESLLPNEKSRDSLKKSLAHIETPENAVNVSGNIGHYLPDHSVAAGTMAATALNYFNSLKPQDTKASPLDIGSPKNKVKEYQYNRALDIAQQPLMVLKYAKDGTLQSQDIKTLNTIYPGLHQKMISKLTENMTGHIANGNTVPYQQRRTLSMLMGSHLDSSLTLSGVQSIIRSNAGQQISPENQQQPQKSHRVASGRELSQINKVNQLYLTSSEQRHVNKGK